MIPASRRAWFARWFARRALARLRAQFGALRVAGLARARAEAEARPLLFVANHSSWWDGLVALVLTQQVLGLEGYALMEARQLQRLRFLGLAGGFGVDRLSRRDGALALRHAAALLQAPGRVVWIFPQGEERPASEPLRFEPGAARVAELRPEVAVVPVGIRYGFGATPRPEVRVRIGEPLPRGLPRHRALAAQRDAVTRCLHAVDGGASVEDEVAVFEHRERSWAGLSVWMLDRFAGLWVPPPAEALPPGSSATTGR